MSENIIMPKLGMTMKEGTVEEWFKSEGDTVEEGEDLGSDDDDSGETNQENKDNDTTSENQQASSNEEQSDKKDTEKEAKPEQRERIFISPLARNMAEDKELDITRIKGTGGNDRITKLDIQRVDSEGYDYEGEAGTSNESASSTAQNVDVSSIGEGLNPMRQRIAQNMRQSLNNTAQLTLHRKVNADRLLDFKARLSEELKDADQDVKLTVTALLAKAVVLALKEYGAMNARYENGELTEYEDVHLGIATSLEDGLMVPVIDNADTKSIGTLAKEIKTSAEAVREGNTSDVQLSGATFTITNMGASGIEYFTPILNLGETGILGVGALAKELVLEGDNVKQVSRIPLSLTFDHQILDGAGAADFLKVLAKYIENPYLLML